jgi:CcmD family protein
MTPSSTPESVPGGTYMLVAYGLAWALVIGYVFVLWRKSKRIEHELADVTAKLNARPKR